MGFDKNIELLLRLRFEAVRRVTSMRQ